ncbi:response regulator [Alloiococcus sp. CFN-8]|uniref:response regulator n=1 Tax=Alloiococcus sp. CFN-8 TaxID=3416081 RepID=UPI003CF6A63C
MSNKSIIMLIEDDAAIRRFLSTVLTANNYKVLTSASGEEALSLIPSYCPDLILLDLGLPDMDGTEIIKNIRSWSTLPIIVVSARGHEKEKVAALDLGADDYITKPFGTSELLARIRTALRHRFHGDNLDATNMYINGNLKINFDKRTVTVDGEEVHLTQNEYKILVLIARNEGKVLTYDYILREIWGPYTDKDNQILRVNMANIRRKLEKNPAEPKYILTEVGVGYRMNDEEKP